MSKVTRPFGKVRKRIVIEADEIGTIRVTAMERKSDLAIMGDPMDSREMILALQKVVMDYCAVMFNHIPALGGIAPHAEAEANHNDKNNNKQR